MKYLKAYIKPQQLIWIVFWLITSCQKSWLEVKSDKTLVVPSTIEDLQALLDYNTLMNQTSSSGLQTLAEEGADNFFFLSTSWQGLSLVEDKNAYVFAKNISEGGSAIWNGYYQRIFVANVALEGIVKITPEAREEENWRMVKGCALFVRAHTFYWLTQLYSMPYDSVTANQDNGIPLRLQSDVNVPSTRASVQQCFNQILGDLKEASTLLPAVSPYKIRPSRAACYGLLARAYLGVHNYDSALHYADACLRDYNDLLDYNQVVATGTYPLQSNNTTGNTPEIIYTDRIQTGGLSLTRALVDTVLYADYEPGDLRKQLFFQPLTGSVYHTFNGSYEGVYLFGGIAADEIVLTRAECYARKGIIDKALSDLDKLLYNRWDRTSYIPFSAKSQQDVLDNILAERRKELCFRGIRWIDLRRLNTKGYNITVKRILNDQTYELPPNSTNYALPIPDKVIELTGMPQNNRN